MGNNSHASVVGSGNTISLGPNDQLTASNNVVLVSSGNDDSIIGNGNTLSLGAGATLSVAGTSDAISASNDVINLAVNSWATISGNGNSISSGGGNNSDLVPIANNSVVMVNGDTLLVGSSSLANLPQIGQAYSVNSNGTLSAPTEAFLEFNQFGGSESFGTISAAAAGLLATANSESSGLEAAIGTINNSIISTIDVADLGELPEDESPFTTDPTEAVADGLVIDSGDAEVVDPDVNDDGVINNSPGDIISGYYRPGNQILQSDQTDLDALGDDTQAIETSPDVTPVNVAQSVPDSNVGD